MLDRVSSMHYDTATGAMACSLATSEVGIDIHLDTSRLVLPWIMVDKAWVCHSVPHLSLELIVRARVWHGEFPAEFLTIVSNINPVLS